MLTLLNEALEKLKWEEDQSEDLVIFNQIGCDWFM